MENLEKYFSYDEPVPYVANSILKYKKIINKEIDNLESLNKLTNEEELLLQDLIKQKDELDSKILYIYPAKVKDYIDFFISVNCLLVEKNKIPDPNIIKMSYLDFLFHLMHNSETQIYLYSFFELFDICLKLKSENIKYIVEDNKVNLILNGVKYDRKDFDNIKKIICNQNIIDYDDTYIDPKVEQALKEAQEFKNRNKKKICSFEEQIVCVMLALGETDIEKINNLTIRKFSMILRRYDHKLHYEIYKTAETSGMVTFKEDIDHWMSELSNKNKFADVIVDYNELKSKIEKVKV